MSCYLDKTFCAQPICRNACGRKMTDDERKKLDAILESEQFVPVAYAVFCDYYGNVIECDLNNGG